MIDRPGQPLAMHETSAGDQATFARRYKGSTIVLDHLNFASAIVLEALRFHNGQIVVDTARWRRAVAEVAQGRERPVQRAVDDSTGLIELWLPDEARVVPGRRVRPVGISGSAERDQHLAIVRALLGSSGGTRIASLHEFTRAAYDLFHDHHWRVHAERPTAAGQPLRLHETADPPSGRRRGP